MTTILPSLENAIDRLVVEFYMITEARRATLRELAAFIEAERVNRQSVYLNFICTHNSRRSQVAQIWAQLAAFYYEVGEVVCYSGGTEVTAFNPKAIKALKKAGFRIERTTDGINPEYKVFYLTDSDPVKAFSKKYDDPVNYCPHFAAIMTCSDADEHCPIIHGASKRMAITYDDPKEFDGTQREEAMYDERVAQIGREMLYAFSLIKMP